MFAFSCIVGALLIVAGTTFAARKFSTKAQRTAAVDEKVSEVKAAVVEKLTPKA